MANIVRIAMQKTRSLYHVEQSLSASFKHFQKQLYIQLLNHRIIRLEKTQKIIQSNHPPITNTTTKLLNYTNNSPHHILQKPPYHNTLVKQGLSHRNCIIIMKVWTSFQKVISIEIRRFLRIYSRDKIKTFS